MAESDLGAVLSRIDLRRDALGLTDRFVSVAAGLAPETVRNMRRQFQKGTQTSLKMSTLKALARVLKTTPGWLMTGSQEEVIPLPILPVLGEVAAGRWVEVPNVYVCSVDVAVPAEPRFDEDDQFSVIVRGTSVNNVARDGDFLICVDHRKAGFKARDNDLVVVKRRQVQTGLEELSARRVHFTPTQLILTYDSHDPHYAGSPSQRPQTIVLPISGKDDTTEVEIPGIVVGVFRPVWKQ